MWLRLALNYVVQADFEFGTIVLFQHPKSGITGMYDHDWLSFVVLKSKASG